MKLVLDTNIYLASLMASGLCYDLTQYVFNLKNNQQVFIPPDIYLELYNKIASKKEMLSSGSLDWLEYQLSEVVLSVEPTEKVEVVLRDKDDNKILECAIAVKADLVITMDKDLLKLKRFRNIGIVHPKTFFFMLPGKKTHE